MVTKTRTEVITSNELTSALPPPATAGNANLDLMIRAVSTSSEGGSHSWDFRVGHTNDFAIAFRNLWQAKQEDQEVLVKVVDWQHRLIEYNAHYTAFLLDQTSEEEFEQAAAEFMCEKQSIPVAALASHVQRVYDLTKIPYTASDIANLFCCEHEEALEAMKRVAVTNLIVRGMLPSVDGAADFE